MIVTTSFELNHKPNRQGLHQINLRVTYNRKNKRKSTGILAPKNYFDANAKSRKWLKSVVDESAYKNEKLYKLKKQLEIDIDDFIKEHGSFDLQSFFNPQEDKEKLDCYFEYAHAEYVKQMAADKIGTANKRKVNHQRLAFFVNGKSIDYTQSKKLCFSQITPQFLESYRNWLRNKNLGYNTIVSSIKDIRTIFNLAINQGKVEEVLSPFRNRRFVLGEMVNSKKEKLTKEEVQILLDYKTTNKKIQLALDCFLFSFFTNGMRTSDVFMQKWSDITDGCLSYRMIKNNKLVSDIKLHPRALDILERYRGKDDTYIFPMFYGFKPFNISARMQNKKRASSLTMINKDLKTVAINCNIEKNITMHIARHSFANIAKEGGTPVEVIKELLNHSCIKTTYKYLASFSDEKLQSATDRVFAAFE